MKNYKVNWMRWVCAVILGIASCAHFHNWGEPKSDVEVIVNCFVCLLIALSYERVEPVTVSINNHFEKGIGCETKIEKQVTR
jgi:hypothetical protein